MFYIVKTRAPREDFWELGWIDKENIGIAYKYAYVKKIADMEIIPKLAREIYNLFEESKEELKRNYNIETFEEFLRKGNIPEKKVEKILSYIKNTNL